MRILTTTTVFCNRLFEAFARPSCLAGAGLAAPWTIRLALSVLVLGVAGCGTVSVDAPADDVRPPADEASRETPIEVIPGVIEPDDVASTDIGTPSPPADGETETTPVEPPDPPAQEEAAAMRFVDRLRESFRLDHSLHRQGVAREIARTARRPHHLARRDRLLEYLPYLCEKVWDRGMPGEICLLPIVESRLDPFAFSKGGAVGLWQFIPATAKRFGLKIDWWVDERRDVVLATDAALDYLEQLHDRFGDWLLAIAAYNWGEGAVSRRLRGSRPNAGFFDIKVPGETSRYVDRLLAYSAIFADPSRFGVELPLSELEAASVAFAVVETGGQVDLARAAEALGCDLDEIYRRNPALNRWATHPEGPHRLLVSAESESAAAEALARIPKTERLAWVRHRIVSGETLSQIAVAYRTSVESLQQANSLAGTLIRAGDHLRVPATHRPVEHYTRLSNPLAGGPVGEYVVKSGDTIWGIARRLGLKRHALMTANHIAPDDILKIGQRLSIPR